MTEKTIRTVASGELARLWPMCPNSIDDLDTKGHVKRLAINDMTSPRDRSQDDSQPTRSAQAPQIGPRSVTP